jgi:hypothetical protein
VAREEYELLSADFFWVGLIGLLVGLTEILSRYRDDPWQAILNAGAVIYVFVNVSAAIIAFFLLADVFQLTFNLENIPANDEKIRLLRIVVAGLGAMALFRSSLFVFRTGDKDVAIGPGLVLQVLLDITDRAVDRARARPRAEIVSKIMKGVDFAKAEVALPTYCFALMQNVSAQEQLTFAKQLSQLATANMSPITKSLALGLALMNLVGEHVLRAAVETLGAEIK